MRSGLTTFLIAITAPLDCVCQAPVFDVASIKPAAIRPGEGSNRSRIEYSPNSMTAWNVGLEDLIQWAYGVEFYQISGRQISQNYDIRAKAEKSVPVSQLRLMLQDLLAKRFNLQLRRETKILPVYALVVAKHGPKLPAPKQDSDIIRARENLPRIANGSFVFYNMSLSDFAAMLHQLRGVDRPVQNRTNIDGVFDITLKSAPEATREGDTSLLFSLIEEQLGLKLISSKGPVEMLLIDHAERPTEN